VKITERERLVIWDRSEGRCELMWDGVRCPNTAAELHHLIHRKMGGRKGKMKEIVESPSNWFASCMACKRRLHG